MNTVAIPYAEADEDALVGTVAATRLGAQLNGDRVSVGDFYQPGAARVFEIAKDLAVLDQDERLTVLASRADVDPVWLRRCVDDRPTMHDLPGVHARAIKEAATLRRLMRWAADVHAAAARGDVSRLEELGVPNAA